jgi:hypothetical protein
MRYGRKILVGKSERKRSFENHRRRSEDIKMNLKEIGWEGSTGFILFRAGTVAGSSEHGNGCSGSF